jgi:hypothetical protein
VPAQGPTLGEVFLSLLLNWLMRGLTVIGGIIAVVQAGPIARAAWQAQYADPVVYRLRTEQKVETPGVVAGIESLGRAIAIDPVPTRYLARSELLGVAALTPSVAADAATRTAWEKRARADLVAGLAGAPAHGIDWLRLATLQLQLEGPSRLVVAMIFTSIEMAGRLPQTWRPRLRIVLECWPLLSDEQKERLRSHVEMVWRQSSGNRRLFGQVTYSAADHAILTWFLRDVPGAPQELAAIIKRASKE